MKKETGSTTYELREDGFIYSEVKKGSHVSLEDAKLGLKIMQEMIPDKKIYLLSDITGIKSTSKEARKYSLDVELNGELLVLNIYPLGGFKSLGKSS